MTGDVRAAKQQQTGSKPSKILSEVGVARVAREGQGEERVTRIVSVEKSVKNGVSTMTKQLGAASFQEPHSKKSHLKKAQPNQMGNGVMTVKNSVIQEEKQEQCHWTIWVTTFKGEATLQLS